MGMTNLWLCLYADCYMLGCSDDVQGSPDHSTKHQDGHQHHHIQLNITTKTKYVILKLFHPMILCFLTPLVKMVKSETAVF